MRHDAPRTAKRNHRIRQRVSATGPAAFVILVVFCGGGRFARGQELTTPPWPAEALADAELADIYFADDKHGWAVGDRGVIWHTSNGGENWRRQVSGVHCRLESVHFVSADRGWVVGRRIHPYTHRTTGVILSTTDGGRRWKQTPGLLLPGLSRVKFFSPLRGIALGDASAMYPSGVFRTDNGGRTWTPTPGAAGASLVAGDVVSLHQGAAASSNGAIHTIDRRGLVASGSPPTGLRRPMRLRFSGPSEAWLVGEGGLVRHSRDGGATWRPPMGRLPAATTDVDLAALFARGRHVWAAGSPGHVVIRSSDSGRTWTAHPTGQSTPLRALHFVTPEQGFAVGSLGAILATEDGGRTWRRVQTGGKRLAVLGVFTEPERAPLELFAHFGGQEGYLTGCVFVARGDVEAAANAMANRAQTGHATLVWSGGSVAESAWSFPVRQPGLSIPARDVLAAWDRSDPQRARQRLVAYLVKKIRQWRPDVVVTSAPQADRGLADDQIVSQVVLEAVEAAAKPNNGSDSPSNAIPALSAWKVKRVFGVVPEGQRGDTSLTTAQLAPRLGRSLSGQAALARGLASRRYAAGPTTIELNSLLAKSHGSAGRGDIMAGLSIRPAGPARRQQGQATAGQLSRIQMLAGKQRNVQSLLKMAAQRGGASQAWLGQLEELTRGLDSVAAGDVIYQVGHAYQQAGELDLAAGAYRRLVAKHPRHALAEPALLWLLQYYASHEQRRRMQLSHQSLAQPLAPVSASRQRPLAPQAGGNRPPGAAAKNPSFAARHAHFTTGPAAAAGDREGVSPPARAVHVGRYIERNAPALHAEPEIRLALGAAHRSQGQIGEARALYANVAATPGTSPARACALAEEWLEKRQGEPPKPILMCKRAAEKPRLDGRLEEPMWRNAKRAALRSTLGDDARWPAVALLAHDAEYLYIAIQCRKAPGLRYETASGPRPRDADLAARDRVEILLDVDRDYSTFFRLVVDHRGWTYESCLGDRTWNPTWYVAAASDEATWTIEAAIPLAELVERPPAPRQAWAVGLQRIVPQVGFQSWTQPAAAAQPRPQGFGLLIFE